MSAELTRDLISEITRLNNTLKEAKSIQIVQQKPNSFAQIIPDTHDHRKTSSTTADDAYDDEITTKKFQNKTTKPLILQDLHVVLLQTAEGDRNNSINYNSDLTYSLKLNTPTGGFYIVPKTRRVDLMVYQSGNNDGYKIVTAYNLNLLLPPQAQTEFYTHCKLPAEGSRDAWQIKFSAYYTITEYEPPRY